MKYKTLLFILILPIALIISQNKYGTKNIRQETYQNKTFVYVEGEIQIQFNENVSNDDKHGVVRKYGAKVLKNIDKYKYAILGVDASSNIMEICQKLSNEPSVKYAFPNEIINGGSDPTDTHFAKQWYLKNDPTIPPYGTENADVDAINAWAITRGDSSIKIAVLDSGIPILNDTLSHEDLKNTSLILQGINYSSDEGNSVRDLNGHGTHVTGIIAAESNNSKGIAGIADKCKILIVKTNNSQNQTTPSAILDGILFAANNSVKIVNISSGGINPMPTVREAIANNPQILFVICAHNDRGAVRYPAKYSDGLNNIMAVSATDFDDEFAINYSNYGPEINVSAPGGYGTERINNSKIFVNQITINEDDIYSTLPNYGGESIYGYYHGTSQSTPIVSAIAGLMLSKNPNLTTLQLRSTIEHTAKDLGDPGRDTLYGYGRVNAYHAILAVVGPQNFRVTSPNNSYISLAWDPILPITPANILQHYEISRNINNWGWSVIATTTNTSYTDNEFEKSKEENDIAQYRIRSKTIDNVYSLYSNILTVEGISYWQQKTSTQIKEIPKVFCLNQNYPNPFNPSTEITYDIPTLSNVVLQVFNSVGQQVARFTNDHSQGGTYTTIWNAAELSSGIYFVRMQAGSYSSIKKMLFLK